MNTSSQSPPGTAAERLLDAAVVVFAREGISKATTREIAKEAGVNEVTLFRNFQTKQGLLAAVLERAFLPTLAGDANEPEGKAVKLEEAVRAFATEDFERKRRNIALMRVLVGESHRLGEHESAILARIFHPWKERLANRLREARSKGLIRQEVDPAMVVDQLVAMTFVGALRAEKSGVMGYPPEKYLNASIDLILHGILVRRPKRTSK
ncbi:MAG: TetR/AcrR family transcriptional regulator [Luteolibacter sp.]